MKPSDTSLSVEPNFGVVQKHTYLTFNQVKFMQGLNASKTEYHPSPGHVMEKHVTFILINQNKFYHNLTLCNIFIIWKEKSNICLIGPHPIIHGWCTCLGQSAFP